MAIIPHQRKNQSAANSSETVAGERLKQTGTSSNIVAEINKKEIHHGDRRVFNFSSANPAALREIIFLHLYEKTGTQGERVR
jgi:hypothetical protein